MRSTILDFGPEGICHIAMKPLPLLKHHDLLSLVVLTSSLRLNYLDLVFQK